MARAIAFLILLLLSPAAYAAINVAANVVGASALTSGSPSASPPSATIDIEDEQLIPIIDTEESPPEHNWQHFVPELHSISFTLSNFIKYGGSLRVNLIVGEALSIRFDRVTQAVYEVNRDDYNNCIYENPINVYTSSPARIVQLTVGTRYFIDRRPNNCNRGLKLAVNFQTQARFVSSDEAESTFAGDAPPPSAPSPTS